jgi:hypothetical protein
MADKARCIRGALRNVAMELPQSTTIDVPPLLEGSGCSYSAIQGAELTFR